MRTLVHLSDLHFGCVDDRIIAPLVEEVAHIRPDPVVVSGDLTQRARAGQSKAARLFLDKLPTPQIVVPGNHDVPLHNLFSRFMRPLDKYRRYITNDLQPVYRDDEMSVLGLNTARSLTIKGERLNKNQLAWAREHLCSCDGRLIKVIVTHHPFDLPAGLDERDLWSGGPDWPWKHSLLAALTCFSPVIYTSVTPGRRLRITGLAGARRADRHCRLHTREGRSKLVQRHSTRWSLGRLGRTIRLGARALDFYRLRDRAVRSRARWVVAHLWPEGGQFNRLSRVNL